MTPGANDRLVGRQREIAAALETLALLGAGPAGLVIEGEAGIGKSEVWRLVVEAARRRGLTVLEARPSEAERALSYAALGDLLEAEHASAVAQLPGPQRRALEVALLMSDPDGEAPDQRAIAVAVLGALRLLAAEGGVVVAIDDAQWLDADSARALTFALRRLDGEPVLALLAHRSGEAMELVAGEDAELVRVDLEPLGPTDTHAMLVERLGLKLPRPLLLRVHAAAGGNPLYVLEIGRALLHGPQPLAATAALPVPPTLEGVVDARLSALSAPAQSALAIVAALAHPTPALVAAVEGGGTRGLDEAIASSLLVLDDDRLRFTHPLYGSVAAARFRGERWRALHRRLAELVDDSEHHALHLALALDGPDREAAVTLAEAARHAGARGAPETALQLAEHALRLAPDDPAAERAALSVDGSDFAFAAGDTVRARQLLDDALELVAPPGRCSVLVRLATLATYEGSMRDARELAAQALREAPDDALRVVAHRRLALAHLLMAELDAAEHHADAAAGLAAAGGAPASLARALANLACIRALRGDWHGATPAIEQALALEDAPGVASIDDSPSAVAGLLRMYAGEHSAAREHLQRGLARAQSVGGDPLSTGLLFALSELESRASRFPTALALARRGLAASEQTEQRTERSVLLFAKGLAEAHLGSTDAARAAADEGRAIAERAGHRFAEAQNRWVLGFLELSLGRAGESWAALAPAVSILRRHEVGELGVVPVHPEAIEALLMLGEVELGRALLGELEAGANWPWLRAAAGRCRGLLLASVGDMGAAVAELERAVEAHRELESPFALARTLHALGAVQRRAKQRGAARDSLASAEARFAELGAEHWAARASAEAARLAGRRPGSRDELTPTERGIAELAAAGRSNREIAGEMFVSERTVEANLTRAYRKLGVRSRTELARRLP